MGSIFSSVDEVALLCGEEALYENILCTYTEMCHEYRLSDHETHSCNRVHVSRVCHRVNLEHLNHLISTFY